MYSPPVLQNWAAGNISNNYSSAYKLCHIGVLRFQANEFQGRTKICGLFMQYVLCIMWASSGSRFFQYVHDFVLQSIFCFRVRANFLGGGGVVRKELRGILQRDSQERYDRLHKGVSKHGLLSQPQGDRRKGRQGSECCKQASSQDGK